MRAARLADGRLHLQDGPIDLLVTIDGPDEAAGAALGAFDGLLAGLVAVLPVLRRPVDARTHVAALPPAARRMVAAVAPYDVFVTPMAAVAGAVADTVADAVMAMPGMRKVVVNNRGDIALRLGPGTATRLGVVASLADPRLVATVDLAAGDGIGGVATSGWPGRSCSLGIADAVTVLAQDAARADAAATLIANAVDVEDPAVRRAPASSLDPDSDLGDRLVTIAVGALAPAVIDTALDRGACCARGLLDRGLIAGALLWLQGRSRTLGRPRPRLAAAA
jgi:ApbE superfamily uncharacterized protein (UPF0280 family)